MSESVTDRKKFIMGNSSSSLKTKVDVFQANFDRLVCAIKPAIGDVARKAFQCKLITMQNLNDAENLMLSVDHRASELLRHIFDMIKANEAHFYTFISILKEVPTLMDLANDLYSKLCRICSDTSVHVAASSKSKRKRNKKRQAVKFSDISRSQSWSSSESPTDTSRLDHDTNLGDHDDHNACGCHAHTTIASSIESTHNDSLQSSKTKTRTINTAGETTVTMVPRKVSVNSTGDSIPSVPSSYSGASVLSSVDATYPAPSNSELDSLTPLQCGCGEQCSLDSFIRGRCQQHSFPYLRLDHLSRKDREKLVRKLTSDAQEMIDIFAQLVCDTFDSLDKREVPVDKLRANTLTFGQQKLPKPYSDDHIQKLASASTVRDIQLFLVRYKYISFFNYGILQKIVNHYGTIEDKQKLTDYLTKFSCFCKRSVFEVPSTIIEQLAPDSDIEQVLVVKVSEHLWFSTKSYFTMEDLYAVEQNIARIIVDLDSSYILLRDIKEGCVELTFAILSEIPLLPLTMSQLVQLMEIGINVIAHQNLNSEHHGHILSSSRPNTASCLHTIPPNPLSTYFDDLHDETTTSISSVDPGMLSKLPVSYRDSSKKPVTKLTPLIELSETLSYTCPDRCGSATTSSSELTVIGNDSIQFEVNETSNFDITAVSTRDTPAVEDHQESHAINRGSCVETSLGYWSIGSFASRRESDISSVNTTDRFPSIYSNEGYISAPSSELSSPISISESPSPISTASGSDNVTSYGQTACASYLQTENCLIASNI